MKSIRLFSILFLLSLCFNCYSAPDELFDESATRKQEWKVYDCHEFSISYPETYSLIKTPLAHFAIITQPTSASDIFSENITLIKQQKMTQEEYQKTTFDELKRFGCTDIQQGTVQVNGLSGLSFQYAFKQDNSMRTIFQYALFGEKYIYLLTLTTQKETFDQYKDEAETVFKSLKLNPNVKVGPNWDIFSNEEVFITYPSRFIPTQSEEEDPEEVFSLQEASEDIKEEEAAYYFLNVTEVSDYSDLNAQNAKDITKELNDGFKDEFKILSVETVNKGGQNFIKYLLNSKKDKIVIVRLNVYLKNNKMYMLMFSGSKTKYETQYKNEVEKSFNSFKIFKQK